MQLHEHPPVLSESSLFFFLMKISIVAYFAIKTSEHYSQEEAE